MAADQGRAFRDNPAEPRLEGGRWLLSRQNRIYSGDRPEMHEIVREMRAIADQYDDRVLIGEIYLPLERLVTYYGEDLDGVHLPFNFGLYDASMGRANGRSSSTRTRPRCPRGPGPTGCSATTTSASRPA